MTEQHDWKTPVTFGRADRLSVVVSDYFGMLFLSKHPSTGEQTTINMFLDELTQLTEVLQHAQRHMEEQNE